MSAVRWRIPITGGAGNNNIQWQILVGVAWTDIDGETGVTYTTGPLPEDTYSYRATITQDAGCFVVSDTAVITVVADPTVDVVASSTQLCGGGNATLTANVTGGTGTTFYQWQENTGVGGWNDIDGETSMVLNLTGLAVGVYNYRVNISQDAGCEVQSTNTTITVVDQPTVSISTDDQFICDGGTATFNSNITGGTGTPTFQWEEFASQR